MRNNNIETQKFLTKAEEKELAQLKELKRLQSEFYWLKTRAEQKRYEKQMVKMIKDFEEEEKRGLKMRRIKEITRRYMEFTY